MNNTIIKSIYKHLLQFDNEIEFNKSNSNQVKKNLSNDLEYLKWIDENFVDLGLPSGTLWCKYNLGATCSTTKESWFGNYYAWGELETKEKYDTETYINKNTLLFNDVVYQTYSKQFHNKTVPSMPTYEQIVELVDYTDSEWGKNINGIDGLNGRIFTSKVNGNSFFIPAAGHRYGSYLYYVGDECYLWTSSLLQGGSRSAWTLYCYSDCAGPSTNYRFNGFQVRGVL